MHSSGRGRATFFRPRLGGARSIAYRNLAVRPRSRRLCETRRSNVRGRTTRHRAPLFNSKSLCAVTNKLPGLPLTNKLNRHTSSLTTIKCCNHPYFMEAQTLIIGERLRALREEKKFSQGEVEKRTGLLRCYISRVENGHTVLAVETLEEFARALEAPMDQLCYD